MDSETVDKIIAEVTRRRDEYKRDWLKENDRERSIHLALKEYVLDTLIDWLHTQKG